MLSDRNVAPVIGRATLGRDGELLTASPQLLTSLGASAESLSEAKLVDLVHPDDAMTLWRTLAEPLEPATILRVRLNADANQRSTSVDMEIAPGPNGKTLIAVSEAPDSSAASGPTLRSTGTAGRSPMLLFWSAAGFGSQTIAQLTLLVVLARLIPPAEFGLVGAALVVVGAGRLVLQAVAGPALVQRPDVRRGHFGAGWVLAILGSTLAGAACLITAPFIADFFDEAALAPALRWLSLAFAFQAITIVPEARLIRRMDLRRIAFADAASWLGGYLIPGIIAGLILKNHLAIVIAVVVQFAVRALVLAPAIERPSWPRWEDFRDIASFSGGFFLGRVGNYGAGQADNILVGRVLGLDALGIYGRAYQIATMAPLLIGQVVDRVMFPTLARLIDQPQHFRRSFQAALTFMAAASAMASALLLIVAPELVDLALGDEWTGVVRPLQVLAAFIMIRTCYKLFDSMARATGAVYARAWRQWVFGGSVFLAAWIGTKHSLAWVAVGVSAAVALNFLLMVDLGLRHTSLTLGLIVRPMLLGLVPGVTALAVGGLTKYLAGGSAGTLTTLLLSVVASGLGAILGAGLIWPNARVQLMDWKQSVAVAQAGSNHD